MDITNIPNSTFYKLLHFAILSFNTIEVQFFVFLEQIDSENEMQLEANNSTASSLVYFSEPLSHGNKSRGSGSMKMIPGLTYPKSSKIKKVVTLKLCVCTFDL